MAGNTVESHTDSELVSGGISRVNTLATWAISTGHHCLFHSPWVDYNRSISRRKEGETKVLPFRITNRDRIKYPIEWKYTVALIMLTRKHSSKVTCSTSRPAYLYTHTHAQEC